MQLEVGMILEGKVTGITNFGAFIELPEKKTGMVHISEVAPTFVNQIRDHLTENEVGKVKILSIGDDGKISLSIKKAMDPQSRQQRRRPAVSPGRPDGFEWTAKKQDNLSFEDMMSKFKSSSEEKMSDLKRKNAGMSRSGGSRRGSK